ncbi:DUF6503 family protein [Winogradskyella sp. 3972H.M.0a.05]|uniref:DUF6503 family protein n=1 Tax=Winogradskyella sp. 3972H.M.0a.05 TaxID=2950277 RepID=UPI0033995DDD
MRIVAFLLFCTVGFAQTITSSQLLDKAIQYHDPQGNWSNFNGVLKIIMETPDKPNRDSKIHINLPLEYFYIKAVQDSIEYEYTLDKDKCSSSLNAAAAKTQGSTSLRETCKKVRRYRDYYTYLYGLPMKLKDPGTIINPNIEKKVFKGKTYLVLSASYKQHIGTDVWNFYFDPDTFAMEVYQFYKTDDKGKVKKDSGEYILLSEIETINGIKMPKVRKWYYNKGDKYLGTDILNKV